MRGVAAAVAVSAVLAAPATASAPTLSQLQRQIGQLRATLAAQAVQQRQLEAGQNDRITCNYALQGDTINAVWHTLNLLAQYDGFQPQPDFPRFDDQGACARLSVTRIR